MNNARLRQQQLPGVNGGNTVCPIVVAVKRRLRSFGPNNNPAMMSWAESGTRWRCDVEDEKVEVINQRLSSSHHNSNNNTTQTVKGYEARVLVGWASRRCLFVGGGDEHTNNDDMIQSTITSSRSRQLRITWRVKLSAAGMKSVGVIIIW